MRPNTEVIKISIVAQRHTKYDDRPFSIFYESEHFGLKRLEINEKKTTLIHATESEQQYVHLNNRFTSNVDSKNGFSHGCRLLHS